MKELLISCQTIFSKPGLHVWDRKKGQAIANLQAVENRDGWISFHLKLPRSREIGLKLFDFKDQIVPQAWEEHERYFAVPEGRRTQIWFLQGAARILTEDPLAGQSKRIRIHLITKKKYRNGKIHLWIPGKDGRDLPLIDGEGDYPYVDLELQGEERHAFNFAFANASGIFEQASANRTWSSIDGGEIWTHSEIPLVSTYLPVLRRLAVHFRHELGAGHPPAMHIWQEGYGFAEDIAVDSVDASGWHRFSVSIYTGVPYGFMFRNENLEEKLAWESDNARRFVTIGEDAEFWTLEGAATLFRRKPKRNRQVEIEIIDRTCFPGAIDGAEIKIGEARAPVGGGFRKLDESRWTIETFPKVETFFRFLSGGAAEGAYHAFQVPARGQIPKQYLVLGRGPVLAQKPALPGLFENPPFLISRPGVSEEDGKLRFVLHSPWASRVRLAGGWMAEGEFVDLQSTIDGTYWWTEAPVSEIAAGLPDNFGGDYHGARYRFILNDPENPLSAEGRIIQDPAAGWVKSSQTDGWSRMVNHGRYRWRSNEWRTPGWDYLIVYQLHASRFTTRNPDRPPLLRITEEIERDGGYLRGLGITAIMLLPLNEFPGDRSWGYDPSYFYAVEESYGGPDAFKRLVDACHQHGIAVLLDVVFNHAGTRDNILWQTARDTYFDGDTKWGSLINFDHAQSRYFFEQNLVYWKTHFRVDGFRFDHTKTIIEGGNPHYDYIRKPGSGGGWEFLHSLRSVMKSIDPNCIMIAEHLPNETKMTNFGGPMDSQWGDDFHDRLIDLCKGQRSRISDFANALKFNTPPTCQQWFNITHYPESHDEVGNVNDRIAHVGGFGRGLRLSKVAAAATLLSRGIPMWFMGAESGETGQFRFGGDECLDLSRYEGDGNACRLREWWKQMVLLRRGNPSLQGPAPVAVDYCEDGLIAFSRGERKDLFIVLNFNEYPAQRPLKAMNLPDGTFRELWNSSWPHFQVEWEEEHTNGGRDARLHQEHELRIPDNGTVILERID